MNITVRIEAQEVADAMNNLATAITHIINARAQMLAGLATDKADEKATNKTQPVAVESINSNAPVGPSADSPTTVAATPSVSTDVSQPQNEGHMLTYAEHVAPTMGKLLAEKGVGVVKELLAQFGVKKGGELPTDKLAAALAQAKELLGG